MVRERTYVVNVKMSSSEPMETLNRLNVNVDKHSEKPCLRWEDGEKSESDLSLMVQQNPRVSLMSFQVGWVQVIEELRWKLNTVSY